MSTSYLSNVRVLDFSRNLAGPYSTLLLSFLGAEVIQIEDPTRQEVMRRNSPAQCADLRLNKLSFSIDLTKPESIALVKELAAISDLVVETFKAGTMARWGIGFDDLHPINPKLVMISLSGMGQSGPEADYRAYAQIFGSLGGLAHFTGYQGGLPTEQRASLDQRVGQTLAFAALAGLIHSRRTGEGQYIDVSARECLTSEIGDQLMDYALNGRDKGAQGNADVFMAPHNCYPCREEDSWVSIAVASDEEWRNLCTVIDRFDLVEDDRFRTQLGRWKHQAELDSEVGEWTRSRTDHEATEILQQAGVAAFPVLNAAQIFSDRHLHARDFIREVEHEEYGRRMVFAPPWRLRNAEIRSRSPVFGEHNDYVLRTLLGKSPQEVADLQSHDVLIQQ